MRPCLRKLDTGFLTNGLISPMPKALGPNCSKLVFRLQTPNVRVLGFANFRVNLHEILQPNKLLVYNFGSFWVVLVPFQICKLPPSLV